MMLKIISFLILFLGEGLAIYSEMVASTVYLKTHSIMESVQASIACGIMGAVTLIIGYAMCYKNFENMWAVTAFSIGSILVVEPILIGLMIRQYPTTGALIGIICGIIGIAFTLLLKNN